MASLGSEVGWDGPAGGSPLVGLAGPLPTLSIYPLSITLGAPRRHSAATGATARHRAPGATAGSGSIRLSVIVSHIVHPNY